MASQTFEEKQRLIKTWFGLIVIFGWMLIRELFMPYEMHQNSDSKAPLIVLCAYLCS